MTGKTGSGHSFTIQTSFEGADKPVSATAYLFGPAGALLAAAPILDGRASLSAERVPRGSRLFIGPTLGEQDRDTPPSLAAMERLNAYEPSWRFVPGQAAYEVGAVAEDILVRWPFCRCRIRGRVVKRRRLPNGATIDMPVCKARVHICEVDSIPPILARLPDPDIMRIRDELRIPWPWPPEPGPGPDPILAMRGKEDLRRLQQADTVQLIGPRMDLAALNPQPLPPSAALETVARFPVAIAPLPPAMQAALVSDSVQVVRATLLENIDFIRPFLCRWHWIHGWFRSDEIRVVPTDEQGRFAASIIYLCNVDRPDLYFWVEYPVGGVWTTVYKPPLGCNIWWNYACGTEVTIAVTDSRVLGCGDTEEVCGKNVIVKTIGRYVSMGEIYREDSNDPADWPKFGTIKPEPPFTKEAPFGGTLEPRVTFGNGLKPANITHYRWSYRVLADSPDHPWTVIDRPVSRHYWEMPATAGAPPILKPLQIGPAEGISGYYVEIDPALPALAEKWDVADEHYDLATAYWDTTALSPGRYELKLELFRKSGAGMEAIDLTAEGVTIHEVVGDAPLTEGSYVPVPASGQRVLLDPVTGHVVAFRLVVMVDNSPCYGTIESVTVQPGANDTKCGFMEYGVDAQATISFRASHPANYATFSFIVSRVAQPLDIASASGPVELVDANGFSRVGDLFSKVLPVSLLLSYNESGTPCTRAAFAESLRVQALATNGYDSLSHLNAPNPSDPTQIGLRAFAITPVEAP